jgi:CheY-like chemotaxis protein
VARILVIDDNEALRSILRLQLEAAGHEVVDAPDGRVGLRLFQEWPADVVLCDLFMPEKEGLETIRELRQAGAAHIIAMSGDGPVGTGVLLRVACHLGADAAPSKPFDSDELFEVLRQVLGGA